MSVALTIFRDTKLDELVNVYSKAPQTERESVAKILLKLFPTDSERINEIKTRRTLTIDNPPCSNLFI